ncbi:acetyl-CoA synthetase [Monoraphidium neglectum]|uniref:Acetyl-CoA synthetase n=1 Tax=Monoraphidium neglectum TaxID=145388 RepID=A0A0D2MY08_9CHLO|nr:acetyl-CoA synthetase [Monoraphidium neglectum]KIY99045.1 acetyl-CoA synthetase [Monoraphidium neglectum]|eukprot:XP_013898065.1 acetyl-CoA synthetase [Monoraphidium neglectum]
MFLRHLRRKRAEAENQAAGDAKPEPLNQSLGMWGSITRSLTSKRSVTTTIDKDQAATEAAPAPAAKEAAPAPPAAAVEAGGVPASYPGFTPFVAGVAKYKEMYQRSIEDPDGFWADIASEFHWENKWDEKHASWNFDVRKGPIYVKWFTGGTTNIAYNCLDRHVQAGRGDVPCFLWEGNEPKDSTVMTYKEVGAPPGVYLGC